MSTRLSIINTSARTGILSGKTLVRKNQYPFSMNHGSIGITISLQI
jgi:hypothetical protein